MSWSDPIADMLTRIRNASRVGKPNVNVKASKICEGIAAVLKKEGYIDGYDRIDDGKQGVLRVTLKYDQEGLPAISEIKRMSKPGCRIFCTQAAVPKVLDGLGIAIISTSKGIFTGKRCEEERVGGEVLCYIW
jgi:small subunit ribosomal protein S8